jgi:hypothetical protein
MIATTAINLIIIFTPVAFYLLDIAQDNRFPIRSQTSPLPRRGTVPAQLGIIPDLRNHS